MDFFEALFGNSFLLGALFAAFAASIASGMIGSYVVVKRIAFVSGSIAHAVLGGIGFFLWLQRTQNMLWATPFLGALLAAIFSALLLGAVRLSSKEREDSIIAALWTVGMAIGVIFISQTPGYNVELTNYLVGNILWVTPTDVVVLWVLDFVIFLIVFCLHKRFLSICFDEEQSYLQGLNVQNLYLLLLLLIAVTVVLLIQVVGIILVMTMLILPPAMANVFTCRLSTMMWIATLFSLFFSFTGTAVSFFIDWPPGATIALFVGIAYIFVIIFSKFFKKKEKREAITT